MHTFLRSMDRFLFLGLAAATALAPAPALAQCSAGFGSQFHAGSGLDGRLPMGATNCNNWTSNAAGAANVGHHDRGGGGQNPNSWNAAHATNGCSQANLVATGGAGLFYCFAQ